MRRTQEGGAGSVRVLRQASFLLLPLTVSRFEPPDNPHAKGEEGAVLPYSVPLGNEEWRQG